MRLKFKDEKTEDTKIIELERRNGVSFSLKIDGEIIAIIWDDGRFYFYGKLESPRYKGRWDE